jgi:hypothetical protein
MSQDAAFAIESVQPPAEPSVVVPDGVAVEASGSPAGKSETDGFEDR